MSAVSSAVCTAFPISPKAEEWLERAMALRRFAGTMSLLLMQSRGFLPEATKISDGYILNQD